MDTAIEIGNVRKPSQSSRGEPELHTKLVERLFLRLSALYGNRFTDMWKGIDLHEVKRCWADELSAYSVQQVAQAVNGLTEKAWPPTLPEFLEMCEGAKPVTPIAAHLPYKHEKVDVNAPDVVAAKARAMALMNDFGKQKPSRKWEYFAKLRDQAPHVMATIDKVIQRDAGHSKPTVDELDDYCRLHGLTPKNAWWVE